MATTVTDRLNGENSSVSIKAPVVAVATSAVALSGLAAITTPTGSYTPQVGDRILVIAQADATTNGIYNANTSTWTRSGDFDGANDVVQGSLIACVLPNAQTLFYQLTTANPVRIGSSALNFQSFYNPNVTYAQTASEAVAGVTPTNAAYAPYPIDIRRYGGDPSGNTASDTAMTRALAVAAVSAQNGGTIWLPAGVYLFNNPIVLNNAQGITIKGDGACTGGAGYGTKIVYSGTGSTHFIQMTSAAGCRLQGLQILNSSNSFTGAMLRCGGSVGNPDAAFCAAQDVVFNATSSCYHLDLDRCIEFAAERCNFAGGAVSVKGQASAGGSYSNVISFYKCQWVQCAAQPVLYPGQSWSFTSCTWEGLSGGGAGAIGTISTAPFSGLSIHGCWFGDASGGEWLSLYGGGLDFSGNYISGSIASTTYGISLYSVFDASIHGNVFDTFTAAINFAGSNGTGIVIQSNSWPNCTNFLTNTTNAPTSTIVNPNGPLSPGYGRFYSYGASGSNGWEYTPNGGLEIWGATNVTSGTPVAVSFSGLSLPSFTTAIYPPQLGIVPGTSGNVPFIVSGTVTTNGFSLNCSGSGANVVYWRCKGT